MSKGTLQDWVRLLEVRDEQFKKISYTNLQEKYIMIIGIRITELVLDAVILINEGRLSSVPIILRSALESYADLRCCIKDERHPDAMTKAQHHRFYEMYRASGNPAAKNHQNRGKKLTVWDRFDKSELSNLYNGYYSMLSMHSHGNIGALVETNVKDTSILLGSNSNDEKSLQYFDQSIYLAAITIRDVLEHFNFDSIFLKASEEIIKKLSSHLNQP
jgi:hypothetical protein